MSKGREKTPVRVVSSDIDLAYFQYMQNSVIFDKAKVPTTLESLRPGDYCQCSNNCMDADAACPCQASVGGQSAYVGGILADEFIEGGNDNNARFCKKGAPCIRGVEICEGHVPRIFLKECNVKCTCSSECGNRVVQQGMKFRLEVFHTGLKGWGIRAAERIPKGAFVFELTGEILTNAELIVRNEQADGALIYSMALDADWATEQEVDDNSALCLDSTHFGNVARFLNHRYKTKSIFCSFFLSFTSLLGLTFVPEHCRCGDPNLVDVPVSIESVDRRCYHVAFFSNRIIEVGEELTWDYGTCFKHNGPSQSVFHCRCNSILCKEKVLPTLFQRKSARKPPKPRRTR